MDRKREEQLDSAIAGMVVGLIGAAVVGAAVNGAAVNGAAAGVRLVAEALDFIEAEINKTKPVTGAIAGHVKKGLEGDSDSD